MPTANIILLVTDALVIHLASLHQVVVTERAGQAFDVMSSLTNGELNSYDGAVAVVRTCISFDAFLTYEQLP